ncbi:MAG: hypothetical protein M3406_18035 [Chloroflexota bacterium]|nr:hypothetical protein [Chloroflexota bacterium]
MTPYPFYTATLVPIVMLVALVGQRAGELLMGILLSPQLTSTADVALFMAKRAGRDRVVAA